jgi:hypothetical protein
MKEAGDLGRLRVHAGDVVLHEAFKAHLVFRFWGNSSQHFSACSEYVSAGARKNG